MKCKKTKNHVYNNEHTDFQAMAVELLRFLNRGSVLKRTQYKATRSTNHSNHPFCN